MFSICPKDLVDKQALSPCKAHEKTFTTNKYMFVLCWEDMTIMKKYFRLMKIIQIIPWYAKQIY